MSDARLEKLKREAAQAQARADELAEKTPGFIEKLTAQMEATIANQPDKEAKIREAFQQRIDGAKRKNESMAKAAKAAQEKVDNYDPNEVEPNDYPILSFTTDPNAPKVGYRSEEQPADSAAPVQQPAAGAAGGAVSIDAFGGAGDDKPRSDKPRADTPPKPEEIQAVIDKNVGTKNPDVYDPRGVNQDKYVEKVATTEPYSVLDDIGSPVGDPESDTSPKAAMKGAKQARKEAVKSLDVGGSTELATAATDAVDQLKSTLSDSLNIDKIDIGELFGEFGDALGDLTGQLDGLLSGALGDLGKVGDLLTGEFGKVGDLLTGKLGNVGDLLKGDLDDLLTGELGKVGDLLKGDLGDLLKGDLGGIGDLLKGDLGDLLKGNLSDIEKAAKGFFDNPEGAIEQMSGDLVSQLTNESGPMFGEMAGMIQQLGGDPQQFLDDLVDAGLVRRGATLSGLITVPSAIQMRGSDGRNVGSEGRVSGRTDTTGNAGNKITGGQPGRTTGTRVQCAFSDPKKVPRQVIVDALDAACRQLDIVVQITPHGGWVSRKSGTRNHPTGWAADFQVVSSSGGLIIPKNDPVLYGRIGSILHGYAMSKKVTAGIGEYSDFMHYDTYPPRTGYCPIEKYVSWGSGWRMGYYIKKAKDEGYIYDPSNKAVDEPPVEEETTTEEEVMETQFPFKHPDDSPYNIHTFDTGDRRVDYVDKKTKPFNLPASEGEFVITRTNEQGGQIIVYIFQATDKIWFPYTIPMYKAETGNGVPFEHLNNIVRQPV